MTKTVNIYVNADNSQFIRTEIYILQIKSKQKCCTSLLKIHFCGILNEYMFNAAKMW